MIFNYGKQKALPQKVTTLGIPKIQRLLTHLCLLLHTWNSNHVKLFFLRTKGQTCEWICGISLMWNFDLYFGGRFRKILYTQVTITLVHHTLQLSFLLLLYQLLFHAAIGNYKSNYPYIKFYTLEYFCGSYFEHHLTHKWNIIKNFLLQVIIFYIFLCYLTSKEY